MKGASDNRKIMHSGGWIVALLAMCVVCPAFADQSMKITSLMVSLNSDQTLSSEDQEAVCNNIQTGFSSVNGFWGLVGFPMVKCSLSKDVSVDQQRLSLHLSLSKGRLRFVAHAPFSKEYIGRGVIPGKSWDVKEFKDPKIVSTIALAIFERLPFLGVVSTKELKFGEVFHSRVAESNRHPKLEPPKHIILYRLNYDQKGKMWLPDIVATGVRAGKSVKEGKAQTISWKLTKSSRDISKLEDEYLFVHKSRGPSGRNKMVGKILQEQRKNFTENQNNVADVDSSFTNEIMKFVPGGFVGARYGIPVGDSAVFEESTFFGAIAEVRSGVLDGFRFYLDIWPEMSETYGGQEATFGGQRVLFGWSYDLHVDYIISHVSIVPTLGYWAYRADLPVEIFNSDDYEIVSFDAKNTLSLGGVLAVDRVTPYYILQGWVAKDFGINFQKSNEAVQVDSTRLGLDLLVHLPFWDANKMGFTLSLLTFGLHEQVALQKVSLDGNISDSTVIEGIEYKKNYVGGGIAISW